MNKERIRLTERIEGYCRNRNATNTAYALKYLNQFTESFKDEEKSDHVFNHAAGVAEMFLNLEMNLSPKERDIAVSSCLLHILPRYADFDSLRKELDEAMDPRISEIISTTSSLKKNIESVGSNYYKQVEENRMALIVLLAQRSDRVSRLHTLSIYKAKQIIYETRKYYFPLCIYGKDHYPELYGAFSVFLEKMRCIVDTLDILMNRFEKEENELLLEKLRLQEENSRLRKMMNTPINQ